MHTMRLIGIWVFSILVLSVSCNKELPLNLDINFDGFSTMDAQGGSWKPVLLTSGAQFSVPDPEPVGSPDYLKALEETRLASNARTTAQTDAIRYWGMYGTVRWNEIARELAAKYNMIPAPNADGSYSQPNPNQPDVYPLFPFAHPPYTSRALAYLSTAQFDGLIAAWHLMYQYNRPSPVSADARVSGYFPETDLPTYPAYDAVLSSVAEVILTAMFPLERDYIAKKAAEHKQTLIWAGRHIQSDVDAGDALGRQVAGQFLARASTDGFRQAQGTRASSDSLKNAAKSRFGWHWENLEVPQRPMGLVPLLGLVQTWCLPDVVLVRPPAPPAPGSPAFQAAVKELEEIASKRTLEQRRIANFWSDGLGTYTPPGHWNRLACDKVVSGKLNPLRAARVLAYTNMAIMDAGIACWDAKYYYHYPRPSQAVNGFKTILGIPNFPAYTSGHSAFSAAAAEALSHFFPSDAPYFRAWAREAADSRLYGGIHYRFDADAGIDQGTAVGRYAVERAKADGAD